jgi:hypothetical protein
MFEYFGNTHMHTPYSDGAKWHDEIADDAIRAGLDFMIVTDHNIWVDGIEGYYENGQGRVLLLVGEELHNPRRHPQASHFLAFGAGTELSTYTDDPQQLVDQTRANGGYGFLAHPFDPAAPAFNEDSLSWQDWDVEGFTGLEIWNYMSDFKGKLGNKLRSLRAALNPGKYISGPEPETLAKWDELLAAGKRIVAIGGSDAHGFEISLGPFKRTIFPYEYLFRAVNTHILSTNELDDNLDHDRKLILDAIGKGNTWVGYDLPHSTAGFRFSGQGRSKGIMGDEIKLGIGATLQVITPAKCHIRLIHNGTLVAEVENDINLTHIPNASGAYRVECSIAFLGKQRGWIYSNPIYLI